MRPRGPPVRSVSRRTLAVRAPLAVAPVGTSLEILTDAIENSLQALAPPERDALSRAVRYALLAPGKRIRPILTSLAVEEFGGDPLDALHVGCALEMVHAASLVMDDLPAMDDAGWRRGRPSTHAAFGEDAALLAIVALLARAHATIARAASLPAETRCELVAILAQAVGDSGLALGQLHDLRASSQAEAAALARSNHLKTGVLFVSAIDLAAAVAKADGGEADRLRAFAIQFGQAYQLRDDLAGLASPANGFMAEDADRMTLVARLGRDEAAARLAAHVRSATDHLTEGSTLFDYVQRIFDDRLLPDRPISADVSVIPEGAR